MNVATTVFACQNPDCCRRQPRNACISHYDSPLSAMRATRRAPWPLCICGGVTLPQMEMFQTFESAQEALV